MKKVLFFLASILLLASCDNYPIYYPDGGGDNDDNTSDVRTIDYTLTEDDYRAIVANTKNDALALAECPIDPETDSIDYTLYEAFKSIADTLAFNHKAPAEIYVPKFLAEKFPQLSSGSKINLTYNVLGRDSIIVETVTFSRYNVWVSAIYYRQAIAGDGDQGKLTIQDILLTDPLTYVWYYSAAYGMCASAFKHVNSYDSESWLVTPQIDLSRAKTPQFGFDHAFNKAPNFTDECAVLVSTNYAGDVKTCDWTQLDWNLNEDGTQNVPAGTSWTVQHTGYFDFTPFVGKKINIAFRYTTSNGISGTWELKNLLLSEPEN